MSSETAISNFPFLAIQDECKRKVKRVFDKSTVSRLLLLLDAGNYPSQVAKVLHVSRQAIYYHIKKAIKEGLLTRVNEGGWPSFYKLSESCKKTVTWGESFDGVCRLHSYGLKFRVVREPSRAIDWRRVQLHNWDRFVGCEGGLTVEKTPGHVIVWASNVRSKDLEEARLLAICQCIRLAAYLCQKFDMELDLLNPSLIRKPHYEIKDPVAAVFANFMEVSNDIGKIDASEGYGAIDYYGADYAKEYLTMPLKLESLNKRLESIQQGLSGFLPLTKTLQLLGDRILRIIPTNGNCEDEESLQLRRRALETCFLG
jgi:predicted DNA-binding protein YlxM (UPF0122 family)